MLSLAMPLALLSAWSQASTEIEVEALRNLTGVCLIVERTREADGIPTFQDIRRAIERELRLKKIPLIDRAEEAKADRDSAIHGQFLSRVTLNARLYVKVDSLALKSGGVCFAVHTDASIPAKTLPHNVNAIGTIHLCDFDSIDFAANKKKAQVEDAIMKCVKKFELIWLKAHIPTEQ